MDRAPFNFSILGAMADKKKPVDFVRMGSALGYSCCRVGVAGGRVARPNRSAPCCVLPPPAFFVLVAGEPIPLPANNILCRTSLR
jgi:hypothetical protein